MKPLTSCGQELGLCLLSPNLHHLICRLTDQANAFGDTRGLLEMWLERLMGYVKRKTKTRGTSDPEKVISNDLGLSFGLESLKQKSDGLLDFKEMLDMSNKPTCYANEDKPENQSTSFLLGSGKEYGRRSWDFDIETVIDTVLAELLYPDDDACNGWTPQLLEDRNALSIYMYDRAVFKGQEVFTSSMYKHEQARDSSHVTVTYDEDDGKKEYVGAIKAFVLIKHNDITVMDRPLRFALIDFYPYQPPFHDEDIGTVYKVMAPQLGAGGRSYPVLFSAINQKLVYCTSGSRRYLVKYNINSGLY